MASDRGYSAAPEGFVTILGDIDEIIAALPADSLDQIQVRAGYGVDVPSSVKLPKGLSAAPAPEDTTAEAHASIVEEPVIEIPVAESSDVVPEAPAEEPASTDSTAATAE